MREEQRPMAHEEYDYEFLFSFLTEWGNSSASDEDHSTSHDGEVGGKEIYALGCFEQEWNWHEKTNDTQHPPWRRHGSVACMTED